MTVHVRLLNEGVEVYRPVAAVKIRSGVFLLQETPGYDPEDEEWEFPPGTAVETEQRELSGGPVVVAVRRAREIWIGLVEVRLLPESTTLGSAGGAFTNVVTWAAGPAEFRTKAQELMQHLELDVVEVEDAEPVEQRLRAGYVLSPDLEEIVAETKTNPRAIRYSTFHTWG